jgi:predicted peroxiredoxin
VTKRLQKAILTLTMLLFMFGTNALMAAEKKTIFYNLTTDEAWAAGMALGQANKALENGYNVVIFLNVRGVLLASKSFHSDISAGSGMSLQDMLKAAMKKGAKAIICPMCMSKVGFTPDDLIEGIVKGGPDVTMKAMTADDTVVISY